MTRAEHFLEMTKGCSPAVRRNMAQALAGWLDREVENAGADIRRIEHSHQMQEDRGHRQRDESSPALNQMKGWHTAAAGLHRQLTAIKVPEEPQP